MILLVGATGFTGQLVAAELLRLKCPVRLAGRSAEKLAALKEQLEAIYHQVDQITECKVIDLANTGTIRDAIKGCSTVINCAGPFMHLGEPVLAQCVESGVHYLDTTGEQPFIKLAFEKYGERAKQSGVAVIPACAFEYALGDAAAALLDSGSNTLWDQITIGYLIENAKVSRGTKKSVLAVLTSQCMSYQNGRLAKIDFRVESNVQMPGIPKSNAFDFPAGEILQIPLHMNVRNIRTIMMTKTPGFIVNMLRSLANSAMMTPLSNLVLSNIDGHSIGPDESGRSNTKFIISCEGKTGGQTKCMVITGHDPYLITAMVAAGVAKKLHFGPLRPAGAAAPSMVAGPGFIRELTTQLAEWSEID